MVMLYFSPFFEAIKLRGWYAYVSAQFGYDLICIIYNNHCDGIEPSHLCVGYPRLWCFLWHCQHPTGLNIPPPSNLKVFSSSVSCLLPFSSLSYVTKLICVESREHAPTLFEQQQKLMTWIYYVCQVYFTAKGSTATLGAFYFGTATDIMVR